VAQRGLKGAASIDVSNDNSIWTNIYQMGKIITDIDWRLVEYDISSVADGESTVYVRWGYVDNQGGGGYYPFSG